MPWIDAFAPIEARYRAQVQADTWGHLAPKENQVYKGIIDFAVGCFGDDHLNPTTLQFKLVGKDGAELDSSPWFYDSLNDFLQDMEGLEPGGVYRFEGTFHNYNFKGKVRQFKLE